MKSILFVSFLLIVLSFQLKSQTYVRGPYLQMITPNSIMIKWRTNVATTARVKYGKDLNNLNEMVSVNTVTKDHKVILSNLERNTKYYYAIGNDVNWFTAPDKEYHFYTWPDSGTTNKTRIWVIGDFGKANSGQNLVKRSYRNYIQDKKTDLWIWLGDNAYQDGTDQEYQEKVFDVYEQLTYMPFFSTPGNHDYNSVCPIPCNKNPNQHTGTYYDVIEAPQNGELGGVPSGTELYYSFDYNNIHFVSINSELGSPLNPSFDWIGITSSNNANNSPMMQWLKQDLADAKARNIDWIIVYFHQPPYSKGSHDSDAAFELYMRAMRRNYLPVLEQYNVDLVLNGHSHVYERSYLLRGFYADNSSNFNDSFKMDGKSGKLILDEPYVKDDTSKKGTVYVVCGNSGSSTTNPALGHPAMYYSHGCASCYGSLVIEVEGKHLHAKYITGEDSVLDYFDILKEPYVVSKEKDQILKDIHINPNPFQNFVQIQYTLTEKSQLTVEIFNTEGTRIATILDKNNLKPGYYNEKIPLTNLNLPDGVYFFRFNINGYEKIEKMVKLR